MIITKEIIHSLTCEESIDWFDHHPFFYNLERKDFNKLLLEYEKQGKTPNNWWYTWAIENFNKGESILLGKKLKRMGMYKVVAPNLGIKEFDNIDEAISALEVAKNEYFEQESALFHVQARRDNPSGFEIIQFCDTSKETCDLATVDEYYSTFNISTGVYDNFPTYTEARNRMIEIRNAREMLIKDGFHIHEKIQEVGAPDFNGEDYILVETLSGKKTQHYYDLDKIEKRPDPKPKKL